MLGSGWEQTLSWGSIQKSGDQIKGARKRQSQAGRGRGMALKLPGRQGSRGTGRLQGPSPAEV